VIEEDRIMRRFLAAVPLLWFVTTLFAADGPKPWAPTKEEAAQGWIALFDGESTFGWHAPNGSKWTVADGYMAPQADTPGELVTNTVFRDYEMVIEYRMRRDSKVNLVVCCDNNGKMINMAPKPGEPGPNNPGTNVQFQSFGNNWMEVKLQVKDGRVRDVRFQSTGSLGGFATATKSGPEEPQPPTQGHIALSGNGVVYRSIKLRPLNGKPIFNGKDLTGWKAFTGATPKVKSEFTVSKEGWLTIKNGPGDLQTEGQWADFIFQGECRTNGKNHNSGVFFRCRPGEYQQGYEAQIHNGFGDTPKKYTVAEYDPKTHELKDKHTVESNALDYGTGAIYNRVPARRSVAKDGEWFTMTIVAEGNHIATWVDGVQVIDWTDNRPLMDNARNGCRLEKGPISLQGHDPTTDLNFRKMSVIDLTPPATKKD
jgi:hypothetical protein